MRAATARKRVRPPWICILPTEREGSIVGKVVEYWGNYVSRAVVLRTYGPADAPAAADLCVADWPAHGGSGPVVEGVPFAPTPQAGCWTWSRS